MDAAGFPSIAASIAPCVQVLLLSARVPERQCLQVRPLHVAQEREAGGAEAATQQVTAAESETTASITTEPTWRVLQEQPEHAAVDL